MAIRRRVFTMLLVAAALPSACGSPGTPSAGPSTPAPTPTITATGSPAPTPQPSGTGALSLHLVLPSNWQSVEMTQAALQNMLTVVGPSNPQLASMLNQLLTSGAYKELTFYAVGYQGLTPIGNVDVTAPINTGGIDADALSPTLEGQLKQAGAIDYAAAHVSLPVGDTLKVSYILPFKTATTTISLVGRIYLIVLSGEAYEATFTCVPPNETPCLADAATMANTLTIGP